MIDIRHQVPSASDEVAKIADINGNVQHAIDFSELLFTRFCHEIASPLSAINNGVDILKEGNSAIQSQALDLIGSSSAEMINRLKFFRYAYGYVKTSGEADVEMIKDIVNKYLSKAKIKFILDHTIAHADYGFTHKVWKLLLNLITLQVGTLIHGGVIELKAEIVNRERRIQAIGRGNQLNINAQVKLILVDQKPVCLDIFNIQIYLVDKLIKSLNAKLDISINNEEVVYIIKL